MKMSMCKVSKEEIETSVCKGVKSIMFFVIITSLFGNVLSFGECSNNGLFFKKSYLFIEMLMFLWT